MLKTIKEEFLAFVLTDMPEWLRGPLFQQVLAACELDHFEATSSSVPGLKFISYHLDWYFRYGTNVRHLDIFSHS